MRDGAARSPRGQSWRADEVSEDWPSERVRVLALASGTEVRFRPAIPEDADHLREGLARLSERTKWLRFHAPVDRLNNEQVRWLVDVDHHDREALVAEVRVGLRRWQPVGVARWFRDPEIPAEAEIAIVVEDAYQGRGIGRRLLSHLADIARDEEGIEVLVGEVLAENRGMLAMLEQVGVRTEHRAEGAVVHTRTWLGDDVAVGDAEPGAPSGTE